MARIFISYRTADGADKATALARDLGRSFGDDQVFLDKDDLRGGSLWAQEVQRTLSARPALLMLVTPQLLGATDAQGRRRIDDPADPVRREVAQALAAGAELIPVLCDGVDAVPAGPGLPAPFDHLTDRTWRRLRAYDWASDVQRLVADLQALGVAPTAASAASAAAPAVPAATRSAAPAVPPRRARVIAVCGLLAAAGLAGWWAASGPGGPGGLGDPAAAGPLGGPWLAQMGEDAVRVELRQQGEQLTLESHPIDIRSRADWADYRRFWRERFGSELDAVRYRGAGTVRSAPGTPPAIDVGFRVLSVPGDADIDGGNLSATLSADGRLLGTRWLNGAQAAAPATLTRP